MSDAMQDHRAASPRIGLARVGIGFAAGLALWALTEASEHQPWPAQQPALFGLLAAVTLLVPFVLVGGLGALRGRTLALWAVGAGVVLAALGMHDLARQADLSGSPWLSVELMAFGAGGLFIAHHLVEGADAERRFIARYPRYFDIAWKHGVQLALSAAFVGVFWIVLFLGGALFNLIGIEAVNELLRNTWFALPATATMFAAAVHITDVRPGLIRGLRTVALTLLSWLLPVLVVLAGAFLLALPFTGLEPLWKTRSAASILLSAAAVLIVLVNAAYQDGEPDQVVPLALRVAGRTAGFLLVPLVALAAYALGLRIGQYGLTPDRIVGAACAIAGGVYAVGYAAAAVRLGRWMRWVEKTNVAAAFVILALLLAIFSPLADPARLSVNDQMARLAEGKVKAERLDYRFLRFESERYGMKALRTLKAQGGEAGRRAAEALAWKDEREASGPEAVKGDLRTVIDVWPKGEALPAGFFSISGKARIQLEEHCRQWSEASRCDAVQVDLNDDGAKEVVVTNFRTSMVLSRGAKGEWAPVGVLVGCEVGKGLREGRYKTLPPAPWRALEINGRRVVLLERYETCGGELEDATR